MPACAAIWVALLAKNLARPPDYLPPSNLGFSEADFVASKLGRDDLVVALSEPDLLFQYELAGRVRLAWSQDPAPLRERAVTALRADRAVWLASDSLFRDERVPPAEMEARLRAFVAASRRGRLSKPERSATRSAITRCAWPPGARSASRVSSEWAARPSGRAPRAPLGPRSRPRRRRRR